MSKQNLKTDNIEIMITTNKNTKPVPLTKDMLYIPKKKDQADSVKTVVEDKQTTIDEDNKKEKEEAKYSNISKYPFTDETLKSLINKLNLLFANSFISCFA